MILIPILSMAYIVGVFIWLVLDAVELNKKSKALEAKWKEPWEPPVPGEPMFNSRAFWQEMAHLAEENNTRK